MGIAGLWDVIGDGEVTTIADFVTKHFEKEGRPLRIAVDEAGWRFNNLTDALNIQMIFVFDGARWPWRRGRRGGGKIDYERIKLLEQTLDHLKVPRHRAPGEAEAECAKMQQAGIVDVVWSDDSDCFMFGATCQMEAHKVGGKRVEGHVRVHYADKILAKHDLDEQSMVLFAMLSGGDYNVKGVPGCGPQAAKLLSRRSLGVANFPDLKALNHYRRPTVSPREQIQSLRGLKRGWEQHIDQRKLRILLRERYNIWMKGYFKHLAPIFMVKRLAGCNSDEARSENTKLVIELKRTRKKKDEAAEEQPALSERMITFDPLPAIEIDIVGEPEGEDWSIWKSKSGAHYDPAERVECEILTCFLQHGLPAGSLHESEPVARKPRKKSGAVEESASAATTAAQDATAAPASQARSSSVNAVPTTSPASTSAPKKRGRPPKAGLAAADSAAPPKRRKKNASASIVEDLPVPTFRQARTIEFKQPTVINLDDSSSEDDLKDAMDMAAGRSHQPSSPGLFCTPVAPHGKSHTGSPPAPDGLLGFGAADFDVPQSPSPIAAVTSPRPPPTQCMESPAERELSPASLRAKRLAVFDAAPGKRNLAEATALPQPANVQPKILEPEIIDLT